MSSMAGHKAADWTADAKRHIFTSRLRIVETDAGGSGDDNSQLNTCVVLEDASSGQVFAAAPYDSPDAVEAATDSSRFFAVRVRDPSSRRKAVLGVGFEERSDAFDFAVALEEARRVLGMGVDKNSVIRKSGGSDCGGVRIGEGMSSCAADSSVSKNSHQAVRDLSLKEGETITVNLGGKLSSRRRDQSLSNEPSQLKESTLNSFALAPPPAAGGGPFLPPPPKAQDVRAQKRLSRSEKESAKELGFDDGQFGEFA